MSEPTIKPGMYGRAFEWRIAKTEKDSIGGVAESFATLSAKDWIVFQRSAAKFIVRPESHDLFRESGPIRFRRAD